MRATLCRASLCVLLSGCYLRHGSGAGDDDAGAPARDAGRREAGADGGTDGGTDAGPEDPGFCRSALTVGACTSEGRLGFVPGEGTTLLVTTDVCHCAGELRCEVEEVRQAAGSVGRISIRLDICNEAPCGGCTGPFETSCVLPPLAPGTYEIFEAGYPSYLFRAVAAEEGVLACQAPASRGGGLCPFPGRPWSPPRICWSESVPDDATTWIEVGGPVSCADEPGTCDVSVYDDRVHVQPRLRSCDEGMPTWDCVPPSSEMTVRCPIRGVFDRPVPLFVGEREVGTIGPGGMIDPPRCRDFGG